MIELTYFGIGLIVGIITLVIVIKLEPPFDGKPEFGEFTSIVGLSAMIVFLAGAVWPLVLVIGGLYLLYRAIWSDEKESVF